MPSKRTRKSIRASCDRLWATLVRARARGMCERCGQPARESHHAYGRANHRLRFDPRNGVSCCYRCHLHFESFPMEFDSWMNGNRTGDVPYLKLEFQKGPLPRTLRDMLDVEADLKAQLEELTELAA